MSKCKSCIHAIRDCYEYYGNAREWFVDDCDLGLDEPCDYYDDAEAADERTRAKLDSLREDEAVEKWKGIV